MSRLAEKDLSSTQKDQVLREKDEIIAQLRHKVQQLEKEGVGDISKGKIGQVEEQKRYVSQEAHAENSEHATAPVKSQISKLVQLGPVSDTCTSLGSEEQIARLKLTWREDKKTPHEISLPYGSAVDGDTLYVRVAETQVYSHTVGTVGTAGWSRLEDSPTVNSSTVVIHNLLTVVGGFCSSTGSTTNQLFSLTEEQGSVRRWTKKFPNHANGTRGINCTMHWKCSDCSRRVGCRLVYTTGS